jgi:hypothetical protein
MLVFKLLKSGLSAFIQNLKSCLLKVKLRCHQMLYHSEVEWNLLLNRIKINMMLRSGDIVSLIEHFKLKLCRKAYEISNLS